VPSALEPAGDAADDRQRITASSVEEAVDGLLHCLPRGEGDERRDDGRDRCRRRRPFTTGKSA